MAKSLFLAILGLISVISYTVYGTYVASFYLAKLHFMTELKDQFGVIRIHWNDLRPVREDLFTDLTIAVIGGLLGITLLVLALYKAKSVSVNVNQ